MSHKADLNTSSPSKITLNENAIIARMAKRHEFDKIEKVVEKVHFGTTATATLTGGIIGGCLGGPVGILIGATVGALGGAITVAFGVYLSEKANLLPAHTFTACYNNQNLQFEIE